MDDQKQKNLKYLCLPKNDYIPAYHSEFVAKEI